MHYLIMRPGAIGDNLLTFPVIQALRTQSNSPHVTFVGNAAVLPLALELGIAEDVFDYNSLQWSELFSTNGIHSATLQGVLRDIDSAICWLRDPEHLVERNLRSLGIQQVTIAHGRPSANERMHIVEYLARTLKLQWDTQDWAAWADGVHTHKPGQTRVDSLVGIRVAIHPGSGGAYKCWPTAHFAALIEALWRRNISVLLLGGPADSERMADLLSQLPKPSSASLLSTLVNAPLLTIAQQLGQCVGYVGNDSGITHLAALLATPTIVLFGPSDPAIWRPLGNTTRVIYEPVLANLPMLTVLSTIEEFFIMPISTSL
jgi:heptosyltransferase-3